MILKTRTSSNSLNRLLLIYVLVLVGICIQARNQCQLPVGRSCTGLTPVNTKAEGLGVYYENPCHGAGCGFYRPYCRLCWIDPNALGKEDRPQCPKCVIDRFRRENSTELFYNLPRGSSCTRMTPKQTKLEGLGAYYENPCNGIGCGFIHPYCRLCWIDPNAPGKMDRPRCPPCVSAILNKQ